MFKFPNQANIKSNRIVKLIRNDKVIVDDIIKIEVIVRFLNI